MSMVKVVDRNIRALLDHRQEQRVSRGPVYLHLRADIAEPDVHAGRQAG